MTNPFRSDFPIFQKYPKLAYLDNAATTQRPNVVIDAITRFYRSENANIHRGIYDLSNQATSKYEQVREEIASFLGAAGGTNIGFTKGTTEAINVVARSFVQPNLKPGDNVVVTLMDHHANFLPWQVISIENQAEFRVVPINEHGDLDIDELFRFLDGRTKMLALNHISNTLGTINDLPKIITHAHAKNIPVLVDAAQSAAYYDLDAKQLEYDFLTFSGHKIFGPFGVGVLYVADPYLAQMRPYNYGGGMIRQVAVEGSSFVRYPHNLEAGTPSIADVIGLGSAIHYVRALDKVRIQAHLKELTCYAELRLSELKEIKILGSPAKKAGIMSFVVEGIHPHDVASFLNKDEIAVRAGMHCTQPLLNHLEIPATVRASFSIYNTKEEIDRLQQSLVSLISFWS